MTERRPLTDPAVQQALGRKTHKYHAKRTIVDGIVFASAKEARRYSELVLLEKAGELHDLQCQPRFLLHLSHSTSVSCLGSYVADFAYVTRDGDTVIEDVKGMRTPLYQWKKKHVEAQYGIRIREL